ncbi:hypothetical protein ECK71_05909 [Escherichia coli K71]|nr:hypothetical protein ECK71_05909 [Escherichia coli K71]
MFPAPAGINRRRRKGNNARNGVPRASGDKPRESQQNARAQKSSPRQRG